MVSLLQFCAEKRSKLVALKGGSIPNKVVYYSPEIWNFVQISIMQYGILTILAISKLDQLDFFGNPITEAGASTLLPDPFS